MSSLASKLQSLKLEVEEINLTYEQKKKELKERILQAILQGEDIDLSPLPLDYQDICYLYDQGLKDFGHYVHYRNAYLKQKEEEAIIARWTALNKDFKPIAYPVDMLYDACIMGDLEVIENHITEDYKLEGMNGLDHRLHMALMYSFRSKNLEVVKHVIQKILTTSYQGVHQSKINYTNYFTHACEYSNREIVDFLISKGCNDWNEGLNGACRGNNHPIVDYMIELGANDWDEAIDSIYWGYFDIEIIFKLLLKGANIDKLFFIPTEEQLIVLYTKGFRDFKNYQKIIDRYLLWKPHIAEKLNELSIPVINTLIDTYV